jgi:hypothetical protein
MQDFLPYTVSMQVAATEARNANDAAKLIPNYGATSPDTVWTANGPQVLGGQFELAVTDSADAAQFGLQTASLSRAGDDGANRSFVAPDLAGIEAGAKVMAPSSVPSVVEPNVSTSSPDSYPLSTLTYAAVTASSLSKPACADYAAFIDYAVSKGQVQGTAPGDLPAGYAPLSPALASQGTNAAHQIVVHCGQSPSATRTAPSTRGMQPGVATGSATASGASSTGGTSTGTTGEQTVSTSGTASKVRAGATSPNVGLSSGAVLSRGSPSQGPTSAVTTALTRLLLPILLGVGLLAALGARWLDVWPRRVRRPKAGP